MIILHNAKVTIDLWQMYNLSNILQKKRTVNYNRKIVSDSVRELAYNIPKKNFSTL